MGSRLARITLAGFVVASIATFGGAHATANLAPNAGFEDSPTAAAGDASHQPMLPTGWIFEGAAALFDHSENGHHGGKRMAAISVPASTPREICQQNTCADSPLNAVKDNTAKYYSVTPHWRTQDAIPVTAGHAYTFSVWSMQSLATVNVGGAITKVRWVDANGLPISETDGPRHIQTASDAPVTSWALMSRSVTAPAGAHGAILLLGAADDAFITQISYDDVFFG